MITVIIPTTLSRKLERAIESALNQTYPDVRVCMVIDGEECLDRVHIRMSSMIANPRIDILLLPESTNKHDKFYGHRIYSAVPLLINSEYVAFLDEDNWYEPTHIEGLMAHIGDLDAVCSRRKVFLNDKTVVYDDFESIGDNGQYLLYDTSTYLFNRIKCIPYFHHWYAGWGGDRIFLEKALQDGFKVNQVNQYTLCYEAPKHLTEFFKGGKL